MAGPVWSLLVVNLVLGGLCWGRGFTVDGVVFSPTASFGFIPNSCIPFGSERLYRGLHGVDNASLRGRSGPSFGVGIVVGPRPMLVSALFAEVGSTSSGGEGVALVLKGPRPSACVPLTRLVGCFGISYGGMRVFTVSR